MSGGRSRLAVAAFVLAACSGRAAPETGAAARSILPPLSLSSDSSAAEPVARGVTHYSFVIHSAPWAIHVLDVDRSACWSVISVKAGGEAVGRSRTSALIGGVENAVGGVNADFFTFTPPGVPVGAAIHEGQVITGPSVTARPVFGVDSSGRPWIGRLTVTGWAVVGSDSFPVTDWNRRSQAGLAWFDHSYGEMVDTASGALRLILTPGPRPVVAVVDSSGGMAAIPPRGGLLSLGPGAPAELRRRLLAAVESHRPFGLAVRLAPMHPLEAAGGFPILVTDSAEVPGLDSAGPATFAPARHPRTLVGLAARGRRILLVTVDGRQEGYSAGMTLRESAALMLGLGAAEAMNLDGGGSTAMAVRRARGVETVNHPSDKDGERPVANALAVVPGCRGGDTGR